MPGTSAGSIIIDAELSNKKFQRGTQELISAVKSFQGKVSQISKSLAASTSGYVAGVKQGIKATKEYEAQISELEQKANAAKLALQSYGKGSSFKEYYKVRREIMETTQALKEAKAVADSVKMTKGVDSSAWEQANSDVKEYSDKLEELNKKLKTVHKPKKQYISEFEEQANEVSQLQSELEKVKQAKTEALGQSPKFTSTFSEVASLSRTAVYEVSESLKAMGSALMVPIQGAGTLALKLGGLVRTGATAALHGIGRAAKSAGSALMRMPVNAVKRGLSGIKDMAVRGAKGLLSLLKHTKKTNTSFGGGFKNILKYAFGIRSLFVLFNRLRSAIRDGLGEMAKQNPAVKTSINALKSSLNGLKGSLATAFAPILTAITPALTTLINMLSTAISYIGAFMAALTGQSTYSRAVGGIEAVGGAASKAAGSAKELNRELAGFDELNVLSDKKGGGGGGGGGSGSGVTFETVPIDSGIKTFVDNLKEMFENGEYEKIGETIAGGVNAAFEKAKDLISWDNVGDTVTTYINAFCGIFNGLIDGINWSLIGETFATGINTIIYSARLLLSGIEWDNLGAKIGEMLSAGINGVDWGALGETAARLITVIPTMMANAIISFDWDSAGRNLSTGANSFISTLQMAVNGINWTSMAENFATGLSNFVNEIDWNGAGALIGSAFNAVLNVLKAFVTDFDWQGLAASFAAGLNGLTNQIDWAGIGQTISTGISNILGALARLIHDYDWRGLGTSVATALGEIDWAGLFTNSLALLVNSLEAIYSAAAGFFESTDWVALGTNLWNGLVAAVQSVDWNLLASTMFEYLGSAIGSAAGLLVGLGTAIWQGITDAIESAKDYFAASIEAAGGDVLNGILEGILQAIVGIGTWIYDNIFRPLYDGFCNAFGINSPATTMEEPGRNIVLGILQGILDALDGIGQWVKDNIFAPIWDAISAAGSTVVEITVSLVKAFGEWASDVWAVIQAGAETVKKIIQAVVEKAGEWADAAWTAIQTTAGTVVKTVQAAVEKAGTWVSDAWTAVKTKASTVVKTVQAAVEKAGTWVADAWTAVRTATGTFTRTLKAAVAKGGTWVADAWTAARTAVGTFTRTLCAAVTKGTWAADAWSAAQKVGATVVRTLSQKVERASEWAADAWSAAQKAGATVVRTLSQKVKRASEWASDAWAAAQKAGTTVVRILSQKVKRASDWAADAWTAAKMAGKTVVRTLSELVKQASGWSDTAWEAAQMVAGTIKKVVETTFEALTGFGATLWAFISDPYNTIKNIVAKFAEFTGWMQTLWDFLTGNWLPDIDPIGVLFKGMGDAWDFLFGESEMGKAQKELEASVKVKTVWVGADGTYYEDSYGAGFSGWNALGLEPPSLEIPVDVVVKNGKLYNPDGTEYTPPDVSVNAQPTATKTSIVNLRNNIQETFNGFTQRALQFLPQINTKSLQDLRTNVQNTFKGFSSRSLSFLAAVTGLKQTKKDATDTWNQNKPKASIELEPELTAGQFGGGRSGGGGGSSGGGAGRQIAEGVSEAIGDVAVDVAPQYSDSQGSNKNSSIKAQIGPIKPAVEPKFSDSDGSSKNADIENKIGDISTNVTAGVNLVRNGWTTIQKYVGESVNVKVNLTKGSGGGLKILPLAKGGVITANGFVRSIPQYAGGTLNAGSLFMAGERGPEVVGRVNGRTEVLNKSQIASAIYSAVVNAMKINVNALGSYFAVRMAAGYNAIVSAIQMTDPTPALHAIEYKIPVIATGTILPYSVQRAREDAALQTAITDSNEELAQVFINALAAQTATLVSALQRLQAGGSYDASGLVQQTIDSINRQRIMLNSSPLKG